jgi:hypothetical protein
MSMNGQPQTLRRISFALLACVGACLPASLLGQNAASGVLPLRPAELLKQLPAPQPDWKLTASNAKHLPRTHPQARAFREYLKLPAPGQPAIEPEKQSVVRITLLDTVSNSEISELFRGTASGEGGSKLTLNGFPAIRSSFPKETDHVDVLAHDRFLVTIALIGPDAGKPEDWLKRVNWEGLRKAAANKTYFDPKKELVFMVERVDELNPARTRTARFSIAPASDPEPSPASP